MFNPVLTRVFSINNNLLLTIIVIKPLLSIINYY